MTEESQTLATGGEHGFAAKTDLRPLTEDKCRCVLILRMGAALNAVNAAQRWFHAVKDAPGEAGILDRMQAFFAAIANLGELLQLLWENRPCIEGLAGKGGASAALIKEVTELSDPNGEFRKSIAKRTRDKIVFHWDPEPFRDWMAQRLKQQGELVWLEGSGPTDGELVWSASLEAMGWFFAPDGKEQLESLITKVTDSTKRAKELLWAAIHAFLNEHGYSTT